MGWAEESESCERGREREGDEEVLMVSEEENREGDSEVTC